MHINDRNKALDTPNGGTPPPLTWHDHRDAKLTKAFAELGRRRDVLKRRTGRRFSLWRWYILVPLCMLAAFVSLEVYLLVAIPVAAFGLAWNLLLPWLAQKRLQALALAIRNNEFGYAIMWEGDEIWTLIAAALQAYGITLPDLFRDNELNKLITPHLAKLLNETGAGRVRARNAGIPLHSRSVLISLNSVIGDAVRPISTIYRAHVERQKH